MSPKEIAVQLRRLASAYCDDMVADDLVKLANELDPPKPQRPEPGTVVRFGDGDFGIATKNGVACVDENGALVEGVPVGSPKPVRILADDEVAVKRSQIQALLREVGE